MLVIRLLRTGKKNQPTFKMVVTDKRKASTHGRVVEEVGFYNPLNKEKVLRAERIKYWLSVGAKPSNTVYNFFVSEKIIEGKKIDLHKESRKKEEKEASVEKAEREAPFKPEEEKPAEEKKDAAEEKPKEEEVKEKKPAEKTVKEKQPKEKKAKKEEPQKEKPKAALAPTDKASPIKEEKPKKEKAEEGK